MKSSSTAIVLNGSQIVWCSSKLTGTVFRVAVTMGVWISSRCLGDWRLWMTLGGQWLASAWVVAGTLVVLGSGMSSPPFPRGFH
ncbi:hypothetical protein Pyn_18412 [Prunus yedoensis var. nudiflora]|uniref:Uncharacterized protein n=1 Tax=Prunus yedoensis var. nudiflora TaxID=2094558 RepID=A0A314Y4D7_PRUYE|nr:hypothetical protein Pyn_18412 [Prunus yedoensis var. nudiflora]